MTFVVPGATLRLVSNRTTGIAKPTLGLVLHTQQGDNSPFNWFNKVADEASSTWWVSKTGVIEQYLDPDTEHAWAQAAGNSSYHSVETEGWVTEALTQAQITALTTIYVAGHNRWGWPLALAEAPGEKGFIWHGAGGLAWGGHLSCPGDLRKAQRATVLGLAAKELAPPPLPTLPPKTSLIVDGVFGPTTVNALRHTLQLADGGWDRPAKEALQKHLAVRVDGVIGPITIAALQRHVGAVADGSWGPKTTAALQRALNASKF